MEHMTLFPFASWFCGGLKLHGSPLLALWFRFTSMDSTDRWSSSWLWALFSPKCKRKEFTDMNTTA